MSAGQQPPFDEALAHRYFAADCFNRAWGFLDAAARTPVEDEAMVLAAMASLWHWTRRADRTDRNLSVGHWQVSRVNAVLGRGDEAMRHAERCLAYSGGLAPFYLGYAHEAVARAALAAGDAARAREHLEQARRYAAAVTEDDERAMLEKDLSELAGAVESGR